MVERVYLLMDREDREDVVYTVELVAVYTVELVVVVYILGLLVEYILEQVVVHQLSDMEDSNAVYKCELAVGHTVRFVVVCIR